MLAFCRNHSGKPLIEEMFGRKRDLAKLSTNIHSHLAEAKKARFDFIYLKSDSNLGK